jgi:hypothetical protein
MQKKTIVSVVLLATAALLIPLLGNMYISGWNWTAGDFTFAWVFFIILGLTYKFVTSRITNRGFRIAAGLAVVAVFVSIWVILATG